MRVLTNIDFRVVVTLKIYPQVRYHIVKANIHQHTFLKSNKLNEHQHSILVGDMCGRVPIDGHQITSMCVIFSSRIV